MERMIIIKIKRKIISFVCAAMMAVSPFAVSDSLYDISLTAEAASASLVNPKLSVSYSFGNKLELQIDNLSSFSGNTNFRVYIDGSYAKTYALSTLKKSNQINLIDNAKTYFKPSQAHRIKVVAARDGKLASSPVITGKTDSATYYNIYEGAVLYKLGSQGMYRTGRVSSYQIAPAVLCSTWGKLSAGDSIKTNNAGCALITGGKYKGYYLKVCSTMGRTSARKYKVKTVVDYAASMDGGRYVWGGASYRATDCSGLTMQAYAQVGMDITHSVYIQAQKGRAVSMNDIQPGDLIICRNYGHVAMYIGNNQIVHAMSTYYGIRIQPLNNIYYCSPINSIRRIL